MAELKGRFARPLPPEPAPPKESKYEKISPEIIDEIRFFYVHHTIGITELARRFNVSPNTLTSRKRREGWDLMRESALEAHVIEKNTGIYSFKGESIGFWADMLEKCEDYLEVVSDLKDFKMLAEARKIAEDRKALFTRIELADKKDDEGYKGILDELAKL